MALTDAAARQAQRRMRTRRGAQLRAVQASYDGRRRRIVVRLSNGLELGIPADAAEGLAGARAADLAAIEISPSGLGLHWPRLDADLYLPALMNGVFGTRRWMAHLLGGIGGSVSSPAKQAAARANGKRGGRPRKEASA
jgi:hypothetical protein